MILRKKIQNESVKVGPMIRHLRIRAFDQNRRRHAPDFLMYRKTFRPGRMHTPPDERRGVDQGIGNGSCPLKLVEI